MIQQYLGRIESNLRQIEVVDRIEERYDDKGDIRLVGIDDIKGHLAERRHAHTKSVEVDVSLCIDEIVGLGNDWSQSDDPNRLAALMDLLEALGGAQHRSLLARGILTALSKRLTDST